VRHGADGRPDVLAADANSSERNSQRNKRAPASLMPEAAVPCGGVGTEEWVVGPITTGFACYDAFAPKAEAREAAG
jgi:hypothetical protein